MKYGVELADGVIRWLETGKWVDGKTFSVAYIDEITSFPVTLRAGYVEPFRAKTISFRATSGEPWRPEQLHNAQRRFFLDDAIYETLMLEQVLNLPGKTSVVLKDWLTARQKRLTLARVRSIISHAAESSNESASTAESVLQGTAPPHAYSSWSALLQAFRSTST